MISIEEKVLTQFNLAALPEKIEMPGLMTLEWLPECKESAEVRAAITGIMYSGEFEICLREAEASEKSIAAYRESVKRLNFSSNTEAR